MTFARAALIVVAMIGLSCIPARAADPSLYRKFGERDGLVEIVDHATDRFLTDARIKDAFDDINLVRFKKLAGRSAVVRARRRALQIHRPGHVPQWQHKGLHLGIAEFNALAEDLQLAMEKYRVPYGAQNQLLALLAPMERDIVTRSRTDPGSFEEPMNRIKHSVNTLLRRGLILAGARILTRRPAGYHCARGRDSSYLAEEPRFRCPGNHGRDR